MSNYKLIQEYPTPGSPPLGYISKEHKMIFDKNNLRHYYSGIWFDPSAYPKYWEKIVEKDYEILSFIGKKGSLIEDAIFKNKEEFDQYFDEWHLENVAIHSVKRLSDSEIFTIGDLLQVDRRKYPITYFKISDEKLFINAENENGGIFNYKIDNIIKAKTPLFTTEDGVDIFETSNNIYYVDRNLILPIGNSDPKTCNNSLKDSWKFFSTREKAEEYILYNKPVLSLENVLDIWTELSGYTKESLKEQSTLISKITEFTKNKLNS